MTVPSLAPPLTLRLLLPPFLVTSLEKGRWWKKWLEDAPLPPPLTPATHTVVTHTQSHTCDCIFKGTDTSSQGSGRKGKDDTPAHFTSYIPLQDSLWVFAISWWSVRRPTRRTDSEAQVPGPLQKRAPPVTQVCPALLQRAPATLCG